MDKIPTRPSSLKSKARYKADILLLQPHKVVNHSWDSPQGIFQTPDTDLQRGIPAHQSKEGRKERETEERADDILFGKKCGPLHQSVTRTEHRQETLTKPGNLYQALRPRVKNVCWKEGNTRKTRTKKEWVGKKLLKVKSKLEQI